MGMYQSIEDVPGFIEHALRDVNLERLMSSLEQYERARNAKFQTRIIIINNTTDCDIQLEGHSCLWGYFWSKPEYAFDKGVLLPSQCGGLIASKVRDLPEGTEGTLDVRVLTRDKGTAHVGLYFDTPFKLKNQAGVTIKWSAFAQKPGDSFVQRHTNPKKEQEQSFSIGREGFKVNVKFTGTNRNYIIYSFEDVESHKTAQDTPQLVDSPVAQPIEVIESKEIIENTEEKQEKEEIVQSVEESQKEKQEHEETHDPQN